MMHVILLTDVPVWVRSLATALENLGAEVVVATDPEEVPAHGLIVNRISTRQQRKDPQRGRVFLAALREWEATGRTVINGSRALELGYSKVAQAGLFHEVGVGTPRTFPLDPGRRAIPRCRVLLKPGAGGFGKGIQLLDETSPVPKKLAGDTCDWVEQEYISAVDGMVHRVEILGSKILYEASSMLRPRDYNYCLANTEGSVVLKKEEGMDPQTAAQCKRVANAADMELGAMEYLLGKGKEPIFIDLNPVSSLYPGADKVLREDPIDLTARHLISRVGDDAQ